MSPQTRVSGTNRRSASWLAWSLFGLVVVLQVTGIVLTSRVEHVRPVVDLASGAALVVLPGIGAVVASRRPGNSVGWVFCGAGVLLAVAGASYGYAAYALDADPHRPGGVAAAWLTSWVFLPAVFGLPPLLFLLFPDGRPLGPRWRLVVAITAMGLALMTVGTAFRPGALEDAPVPGVENPVAIYGSVAVAIELIGWITVLACIVLATWSLVLRYRRSSGDARLQLRWFVFSAVLFGAACALSTALFSTRFAGLGQALILTALNLIPLAAAIAILRHRLYDIDIVINRTIVYGALSATLLAVYLGSVLVLQLLLRPATDQSDVAVATSTLAVAALFRPARSRIQSLVDRRFYRRRYDAARTVAAFSSRLRAELDLEAVAADLRGAVRETVQPQHVSLWLRS
jgi:hypothetical protein